MRLDICDFTFQKKNSLTLRESPNIVPDSYSRIVGTSSSVYNLMAFKIRILTEQLAGALVLLVYEYFLTLDDEVELIWPYVNYSTVRGRVDRESIQETKSFVSQGVVFIYEIFRGGMSARFVPYIPMLMVLR